MNIKQIITAYLREHGYDGLAGEQCGCTLDDLFTCYGEWGCVLDCVPGRVTECPDPENCESCEAQTGLRHIVAVEDKA